MSSNDLECESKEPMFWGWTAIFAPKYQDAGCRNSQSKIIYIESLARTLFLNYLTNTICTLEYSNTQILNEIGINHF